jgi:hypothetical protein
MMRVARRFYSPDISLSEFHFNGCAKK